MGVGSGAPAPPGLEKCACIFLPAGWPDVERIYFWILKEIEMQVLVALSDRDVGRACSGTVIGVLEF